MHYACWLILGKKRICPTTNKNAALVKLCIGYQYLEEREKEYSHEKYLLHDLENFTRILTPLNM